MVELVLGSLLGVIASIVGWFAVNHALRPSLGASSFVSRIPSDKDGRTLYRIKVENRRRWRGAIDVSFSAQLVVLGRYETRPENQVVTHLRVKPNVAPELRTYWVLSVDFYDQPKEPKPNTSLEEWLALGTHVKLRLYVSYADSYSGVRRTDRHDYFASDLEDYHFLLEGLGRGKAAQFPASENSN